MKEHVNNLMEFAIFKPDDENGELDKVSTWCEFRQVQIKGNRNASRKAHS
jgi:hypothetical protein